MKRRLLYCMAVALLAGGIVLLCLQSPVNAHCQVPCGIYNDHARIEAMLEDATTITKAMTQIATLSSNSDALSLNQATRWIMTKEEHASRVLTTVAEYFLTQKVEAVAPTAEGYQRYLELLAVHHRVMRAAMKTKQSVNLQDAAALQAAIEELGKHYPSK